MWAEILAPDAASGCPSATAPPHVLNFSVGKSSAFWQDSAWAANASLISICNRGNPYSIVQVQQLASESNCKNIIPEKIFGHSSAHLVDLSEADAGLVEHGPDGGDWADAHDGGLAARHPVYPTILARGVSPCLVTASSEAIITAAAPSQIPDAGKLYRLTNNIPIPLLGSHLSPRSQRPPF